MNIRILRLIALLLSLCFLSACSRSVPMSENSFITLPPAENRFTAPRGDTAREYAQTVSLYLPSVSNNLLINVPEKILIPADQHPAEATVRKLLSFSGSETANPLFSEANIQLQNIQEGIEISGSIATVNLSANAMLLPKFDLFTLKRAITNTLLQWQDIKTVNVLVAGIEPGTDPAGSSPSGSMQSIRNEDVQAVWDSLSTRWSSEKNQSIRFSSLCTIYFPASFGRGILSEARTVSFPGQAYQQLAGSLLEAMSAGAQILSQTPPMPDLNALLAEPIKLEENDTGDFVINFHFLQEANETFVNAGIPRSVMMAAITYTMCTFIPKLQGVKIQIGNELIEGIVPSAIYEKAGEKIIFTDSVLRRSDFSSFLLSDCELYFANHSGYLKLTRRPIPYRLAFNRRYIIEQLMQGPQVYDSVPDLLSIFPQGIHDQDLIALDKEGSTVLVNFTDNLILSSQKMSSQQERLMVYGIVNTLCSTRATHRVRFYINGAQHESFAGSVYLPGEFLMNPEIIR
ncbi:MAG: GerMN domain-containing protein [Clostridiales bacterium]|nr:GerMN domain-containing protein [Clostridiales bacterium]